MQHSISKEDIENLPLEQFNGKIYIIESQEQMQRAVEMIRHEKILGFDTETKPSFKKGVNHKVALLQLASDTTAWLFRLNKTGICDGLLEILENVEILKIGAALRDDVRALERIRPFNSAGFVELQEMAKKQGIEDFSLKKLAALTMGICISKRQRLSNWEQPTLTESQAHYAATDAWVALGIYKALIGKDKN